MKRIHFLLLLTPALISFVAATQDKKSDREEDGFKGDVKSYVTVSYHAALKFDELVKGERIDSLLRSYNVDGNETSLSLYLSTSRIPVMDYQKTYNSAGVQSKLVFNEDGKLSYTRESLYDDKGNFIESNTYNPGGQLTEKVKYKYNTKGQRSIKTTYSADGQRKSREYRFYNATGLLTVVAEVDGNGVLQQQTIMIYDEHNRIARRLQYDGSLWLQFTEDYFYDGTTEQLTAMQHRSNPIRQLITLDPATYNENGVIHQDGKSFTFDEYGMIKECVESGDGLSITDVYENGVLRKSIISQDDFTMTGIYNAYGDLEKAEKIDKITKTKTAVTYTYNSLRQVIESVTAPDGERMKFSYEASGRLSSINVYSSGNKLDYSQTIRYDNTGGISGSRTDYTDPSKSDSNEEFKMEQGYFVDDEPLWWTDGMMHTLYSFELSYNTNGHLTTRKSYGNGEYLVSTYTHQLDAKGNWIYQLETDQHTGKPVTITERKIYYR